MCERKPGRRCSSDAAKAKNLADTAYSNFNQEEYTAVHGKEKTEEKLIELISKRYKTKLHYRATPEGIDDLDRESKSDDFAISKLAKIELNIVTEQREWQKNTLASLTRIEETQGSVGAAKYTEMTKALIKKEIELEDIAAKARQAKLKEAKNTLSTDDYHELIKNHAFNEFKHATKKAYWELRVEDLEAYKPKKQETPANRFATEYTLLHKSQHETDGLEPGECFQGSTCDRL